MCYHVLLIMQIVSPITLDNRSVLSPLSFWSHGQENSVHATAFNAGQTDVWQVNLKSQMSYFDLLFENCNQQMFVKCPGWHIAWILWNLIHTDFLAFVLLSTLHKF